MRGWRGTAALLAVLSACSDLPLETPVAVLEDVALEPAATVTTASCDKYWTIAVSGTWDDSLRWSPAGAPEDWDTICFEAAGSYTVTLGHFSSGEGLHIGDGADVTFTAPDTEDFRADVLTIARTGRLTIRDCAKIDVDSIASIAGNLTVLAPGTCTFGQSSQLESVQNDGLLEVHGAEIWGGWERWVNDGEIRITGESRFFLVDLDMASGLMSGTGRLTFDAGDFSWSGGALPPRRGDGTALVVLADTDLDLIGSSMAGAIDIRAAAGWGAVVRGHIPAGVDLGVEGGFKVQLEPPSGASTYRISGRLTGYDPDTVVVDSDVDVVNTGTIVALSGELLFTAPSLDNRGAIDAAASLRLGTSLLENRGTIDVAAGGRLALSYSDYIAHPAGTMSGRLELLSLSELHGNGSLGDVVVIGSGTIISPGTAASPVGRLTMESLALGTNATTVLDLGGTRNGDSDQIRVATALSYAGTLEVRTLAPFVGGLCGQNIPLIHLADSTRAPSRSFRYLTGMQQGVKSQWRPYYAPRGLRLVGFDPSAVLSFSAQRVTVTEGGASGSVEACLGPDVPARTVDFALTSGGSQVTVQPVPLRFDLADWPAPRAITVTAIDDGLAEGPHGIPLRFTASSADARYDNRLATGLTADIVDNDPGADLALTLTSAPAAAALNQTVEARYRITNAGPAASSGSTFTFAPLAGLSYVGNSSAVTCTTSTGLVTCTAGPLASGAQVEFTIVFRAQTAGAHVNTARIAGVEYDANASNDVAVWALTVS